MESLKGFVVWIVVSALTVFLLFRVMGAMLVYEDADILLRAPACTLAPKASEVDGQHNCRVHGSVSRTFVTDEVEITLPDNSQMLIPRDDMLGFGHSSDSVRYAPFGKAFAFSVGLAIILVGWWLSIGAPRARPVKR